MAKETCQNPNTINRRGCLAMPKEEIELQLKQILSQLSNILTDTKEIKNDLQQHSIDMVGIKKDIERIDKEREEDKNENEKQIKIAHKSIKSREEKFTAELDKRDKKQMWLTTLIVGIIGTIATFINIFMGK